MGEQLQLVGNGHRVHVRHDSPWLTLGVGGQVGQLLDRVPGGN